MKILLIILFLSSSAMAGFGVVERANLRDNVIPDYCQVEGQRKIQTIDMPKDPDFFFRTTGDGKFIFFISNSSNATLNTQTGEMKTLFGTVDPVPSPDGKILTAIVKVPAGWSLYAGAMENGAFKGQPQDLGKIGGTYPSVGMPNNAGEYPVLIFDEASNSINVHSLSLASGGKFKLNAIPFFSLRGEQWRLPLLAPNGKRLSVLNTKTNKTEIYEVSREGGKRLYELPFAGGKTSFSADGTKVAFHLNRIVDPNLKMTNEGVGRPNEGIVYLRNLTRAAEVRNIFVHDLKTGVTQQVTNNITGNSYYPVFLNDGRVAYVNNPREGQIEIQYSTIPAGPQRSIEEVIQCYGDGASEVLRRLAEGWVDICTNWTNISDDANGQSMTTVLGLSKKTCMEIAKAKNDSNLVRLCKAMEQAGRNTPRIRPQSPGKQLLETRCTICHTGKDEKWFSSKMDEVRKRINSMDPKLKMPPIGSALNSTDQKVLLDYLAKFK